MPIFAQGVPKNKLTILYFVRSANIDLMREQIHRAMVENDCMSYFDFQTAMYEMEQDGMIAAIPRAFGQAYRITAPGESVLSMFEESLPFSLRQRLADYADSARESMRLETQLLSSMEELYSGAYMVHLKAVERNDVVLDISMKLASRTMAQRARKNWGKASEEIYAFLLKKLLFTEEAGEECASENEQEQQSDVSNQTDALSES
jgi:hypothetical protein